jgi:hypothetical protein
MIGTVEEEIANPFFGRPHVVILGAGASRASFPKGEAAGRHLCDRMAGCGRRSQGEPRGRRAVPTTTKPGDGIFTFAPLARTQNDALRGVRDSQDVRE